MARYKLILAYDGTRYKGFQKQPHQIDTPTIQGSLESTLKVIGWCGKTILAAGRTDSGVHATGQVIAFDLNWRDTTKSLLIAMNSLLPPDIVIKSVEIVNEDFHPRYDAMSRLYRYRLYCAELRDPLINRFAWRIWPSFNSNLFDDAAQLVLGNHDFSAFGNPMKPSGSKIRTVFSSHWSNWETDTSAVGWQYEIEADGFLYRMVRRIVFLLVCIGQGKMTMDKMNDLLQNPPLNPIQGLVPPHGLVLISVTYPSG